MDPDYAVFARIVETGSLSAAARELRVSPAMVSKRLARLESRLGVRLLHRTTRRLALTDKGERFHADLRAVLHALAEAERRLAGGRDEPAGALRVTAPTSLARLHIVPLLPEFLDRHPRVRLELDLSDAYADLIDRRFDVAIRIVAAVPASLDAHRLGPNRRILCASPGYIRRRGAPASVSALPSHRLLAATGQLPWRLANGRRRQTVHADSFVRTNSSEVVRELAAAGAGIALRSLWDVARLLVDGTLVPVLPGWEGQSDLAIYAVHPRGPSIPPAVTALVTFLRERLDLAADPTSLEASRRTTSPDPGR